jgi:hypothetical protein
MKIEALDTMQNPRATLRHSSAESMKKSKLLFLILMLPLPVIAALIVFYFQGNSLIDSGQSTQSAYGSSNAAIAEKAQAITSFTFSPATMVGGDKTSGTITLRHPAPAGGVTITLNSSGLAVARIPKSVIIPAGERSASFEIATSKVSAQTTVGLSASYQSETQTDSLTVLPPERAGWYVAPDGSPKGKGTLDSPWDLATALAKDGSGAEVKPGDTIWLRGGRYTGNFVSTLAGKENAPIIVRALPGERVVLDRGAVSQAKQPALKVKGGWVWFWGLEIMNSTTDRSRKSPYDGKDEPWRGSGADVYAPNVKFINMVFHDNGHGIWDKEDMTEVHGCLFFYNGNNKREHALYIGNTNGTKYITDNILFAQGGYGILAHSNSPSSSQKGLHLEGNVSFNNGMLTLDDQTTGNIQVGGVQGVSAERIVLKNNYVYNSAETAASKNHGIRLGYEDKGNRDARLLDNYIVSRDPIRLWWWQSIEFLGNTIYSPAESLNLELPQGISPSAYRWDFNTYFSGKKSGASFSKDLSSFSFTRWQQTSGLDAHSQVIQTAKLRPEGVRVFVRPNRYERGRAHIIVFNWDLREQVEVDLSSILPQNARFEVRDAQNYFGEPVLSGNFKGAQIQLPMKLQQVAPPVGNVERVPLHTAPEFAVFIVKLQTGKN